MIDRVCIWIKYSFCVSCANENEENIILSHDMEQPHFTFASIISTRRFNQIK